MNNTIAIIDDEPWVSIDLTENIEWEELGYTITNSLYDPILGLKYICETNPDVVIVDINMPTLDGLSLIKKAQENGCTSQFIILTAYKKFSFAQEAIRQNVRDYIVKPINPNEIFKVFSKLKEKLPCTTLSNVIPLPEESSKFHEIIEFINQHLDQKLTLQLISDTFFINRNYICNLFRKELNCTFSQYLTDLRLKKAKALLVHKNYTITDISTQCGFNDEFYFNKVFKKSEGVTPGLYRQLNRF